MSEQFCKPRIEPASAHNPEALQVAIEAARAIAEQSVDDGNVTRLRLREAFTQASTKRKRR